VDLPTGSKGGGQMFSTGRAALTSSWEAAGATQSTAGAAATEFARDPDRDWLLCGRGFDRLTASAADVAMRGCERREGPLTTAEGIVQWRVSVTVVSLIVACPVAAPRDCEDTLTLAAPGRPTATAAYSAKRGMATEVVMPTNFTDLDDAARQLNGAVASTVGDSVRFGDLPDGSTDSFLDALGVPRL
jgi:hypothetical protein